MMSFIVVAVQVGEQVMVDGGSGVVAAQRRESVYVAFLVCIAAGYSKK